MGLFDFFKKSSSPRAKSQSEIDHYNTQQFQMSVMGTIEMLPHKVQHLAMDFIDRWNEQCHKKGFWQIDTSEMLIMITEDARKIFKEKHIPIDDETLFNMFQIIVLSYAYSASDQPRMREFIGIKM
jgi:hypothetical protein